MQALVWMKENEKMIEYVYAMNFCLPLPTQTVPLEVAQNWLLHPEKLPASTTTKHSRGQSGSSPLHSSRGPSLPNRLLKDRRKLCQSPFLDRIIHKLNYVGCTALCRPYELAQHQSFRLRKQNANCNALQGFLRTSRPALPASIDA